ncbi:hypothetical protein [Glycomyces albidus]|uniref:hypothetical protein n=1 Tax=Glycomyces albidus TaxID=2656774 RepID=UPI0018844020|nr:hypothetical protein [Glycomyces albidus]
MEPLQTKPVYHHPIPPQIVGALALIGCDVLWLALVAAAALIRSASDPNPRLALALAAAAAAAAAAHLALGVCIAARQNWARIVEIALGLLTCFQHIPVAIGFSFLPAVVGPGLVGGVALPAYGVVAFCLALLLLLHNEAAEAYTYRGGGGRPPEE